MGQNVENVPVLRTVCPQPSSSVETRGIPYAARSPKGAVSRRGNAGAPVLFKKNGEGGEAMADYEKMYHILFHAITRALAELEQQNAGLAAGILRAAQQMAEELYIADEA